MLQPATATIVFATIPLTFVLYLQEYKSLVQGISGSEKPLPMEDYALIYKLTGTDVDGTLCNFQARVESRVKRLQSYFKFMTDIPGIQEIPGIDQETLASCK